MQPNKPCLAAAILALLLMSSCGSSPVLYTYTEHDAARLASPLPDKARIVFIRPQKTGFAGVGFVAVYDGDELLGGLAENSYFVRDVAPGEHLFGCYADPPGMDFMRADIEGGLTYYVQCSRQDRVMSLAAHIFAIKDGSPRMNEIDNFLAPLQHSVLTADGLAMYKIVDGPDGKEIVDTRAGMVDHHIDVDGERADWLARADEVGKDWLLTTDGVR